MNRSLKSLITRNIKKKVTINSTRIVNRKKKTKRGQVFLPSMISHTTISSFTIQYGEYGIQKKNDRERISWNDEY